MCAMSAPGCITVSHATAEMLGANYETIYRGEHAVKGKVTLTLTLAPALTLALTSPGPNQGNLPLYYLVGRTNETLREARVYTPAETPPALCASTAGVPLPPPTALSGVPRAALCYPPLSPPRRATGRRLDHSGRRPRRVSSAVSSAALGRRRWCQRSCHRWAHRRHSD